MRDACLVARILPFGFDNRSAQLNDARTIRRESRDVVGRGHAESQRVVSPACGECRGAGECEQKFARPASCKKCGSQQSERCRDQWNSKRLCGIVVEKNSGAKAERKPEQRSAAVKFVGRGAKRMCWQCGREDFIHLITCRARSGGTSAAGVRGLLVRPLVIIRRRVAAAVGVVLDFDFHFDGFAHVDVRLI